MFAKGQAMQEANVVVSDNARPEDLQFLEDQVNEFNFATTGFRDARLLVILLRDAAGQLYAGPPEPTLLTFRAYWRRQRRE